ncbi:MAG: hypothetical protein ABL963_15735 [Longimicrobiales bacterium]
MFDRLDARMKQSARGQLERKTGGRLTQEQEAWLASLSADDPEFDPATLGDPAAMNTEWTSLRGAGRRAVSYRRFTQVSPDRVVMRPPSRATLFTTVFAGLPTLAFVYVFTRILGGWDVFLWMPIAAIAVILANGLSVVYRFAVPVVFDRRGGDCWIGFWAPSSRHRLEVGRRHGRLDRVLALQLVSRPVRRRHVHELNLVFDNGMRMGVSELPDLAETRASAEALSAFLGKPVWDAAVEDA